MGTLIFIFELVFCCAWVVHAYNNFSKNKKSLGILCLCMAIFTARTAIFNLIA